jgi:hypothetical protein
MQKLTAFLLALALSLAAFGAQAAASAGFSCDFVRVASKHAPACAPQADRSLVSMVDQRAERSEASRCREPVASGLPVVDRSVSGS